MNLPPSRGPQVAFFGGSFDPPHLGHLAIAQAAQQALALDTVLFAPVGAQPLKPQGSTASFAHRLAMTRLAIAAYPGFAVSMADAPKPSNEPNYTLDTLLKLRAEMPSVGTLFCLMGADSFAQLRHWHRAAEIPFAAPLIVASRPGQPLDDLMSNLPDGLLIEAATLPDDSVEQSDDSMKGADFSMNGTGISMKGTGFSPYINAAILNGALAPEGQFSAPSSQLRRYTLRNSAGEQTPFYLLPHLEIEISASEIRSQFFTSFESNAKERKLLPLPVSEYIRAHGLYQSFAATPSKVYD
jgi:nicotinate-nucleotide adenylyltransferase